MLFLTTNRHLISGLTLAAARHMSDAIFPDTFVSSTLLAQKANSWSRAHYNTRKKKSSVSQLKQAQWLSHLFEFWNFLEMDIMSNLFSIIHYWPINHCTRVKYSPYTASDFVYMYVNKWWLLYCKSFTPEGEPQITYCNGSSFLIIINRLWMKSQRVAIAVIIH